MKTSKNLYLQIQIAEILRGRSESSGLTISQIYSKLKKSHGFEGTRKTVERNLHGMSNDFKLSSFGLKPAKYWIEDYFEPDLKIGLNPYQLQLIIYSLRNLAQTSSGPLKKSLKTTEASLFANLPIITKNELNHSLKIYEDSRLAKPHPTWSKNNLELLFLCARKDLTFKARMKLQNLTKEERHTMYSFKILKLWFEDGDLVLKVLRINDKKEIRIEGRSLNGIQIIN